MIHLNLKDAFNLYTTRTFPPTHHKGHSSNSSLSTHSLPLHPHSIYHNLSLPCLIISGEYKPGVSAFWTLHFQYSNLIACQLSSRCGYVLNNVWYNNVNCFFQHFKVQFCSKIEFSFFVTSKVSLQSSAVNRKHNLTDPYYFRNEYKGAFT